MNEKEKENRGEMFKEWYHRVYEKAECAIRGEFLGCLRRWLHSFLKRLLYLAIEFRSAHSVNIRSLTVCARNEGMNAFFTLRNFSSLSFGFLLLFFRRFIQKCSVRIREIEHSFSWLDARLNMVQYDVVAAQNIISLSLSRSCSLEFEINGWGTFVHNNIWCRCYTPTSEKCTRFLTELDTFHYCCFRCEFSWNSC